MVVVVVDVVVVVAATALLDPDDAAGGTVDFVAEAICVVAVTPEFTTVVAVDTPSTSTFH